MKTFITPEFSRPSIDTDADFRSVWTAVDFKSDLPIHEVVGHYDWVRLQWLHNFREAWEFKEATIMLKDRMIYRNRYIITFSQVQRAKGEMNLG